MTDILVIIVICLGAILVTNIEYTKTCTTVVENGVTTAHNCAHSFDWKE